MAGDSPSSTRLFKNIVSIPNGRLNAVQDHFDHYTGNIRFYGILSRELADVFYARERYLAMSLTDKRQHYADGDYTTLNDIPTWKNYYYNNQAHLHTLLSSLKDSILSSKYPKNAKLSEKVSLWRGDITKLEVGAIVNAANNTLLGGGGVDGAIHRSAGPELLEECKLLNGCKTGQAKMTGGYKLPAKYIIHTVGPRGEKPDLLQSCYQECMELALKEKVRSIAFPCISTGIYGYPQDAAALVALKTIRTILEKNADNIDRIIFCTFLPTDVSIYESYLQLFFPVD